jgi:hypothetical protein
MMMKNPPHLSAPIATCDSLAMWGVTVESKSKLRYGISLGMICLVISSAAHSQEPALTGQTYPLASQQSSPVVTAHEEMKFKLVRMSKGWTKKGFAVSGMNYESAAHVKVYLKIVHTGSREGAKKEYDDWLKEAAKIIEQGNVQDKPATKPATTEDRAVIVVLETARDCEKMFTVVATAGTVLRIIQSCSLEAAVEFEKQAKLGESMGDRLVSR